MRLPALCAILLSAAGCGGGEPPPPDDAPLRVSAGERVSVGRPVPLRLERVWAGRNETRRQIGLLRTVRREIGPDAGRLTYHFVSMEMVELGHMTDRGATYRFRYDRHLDREVHEEIGSHSLASAACLFFGVPDGTPISFDLWVGLPEGGEGR